MNIPLPPALDRMVCEKVAAGFFANESEVVSEALRRGLAQDIVLERVRDQAAEGFSELDAGEFDDLTREELLSRLSQRRPR